MILDVWICDAGEITVIPQVCKFDAPANWIYSRAQREFFVSLTFSLSHRIQGSENFFRKALAPKSLKGPPWAIFAHIMEYGDNTLFGRFRSIIMRNGCKMYGAPPLSVMPAWASAAITIALSSVLISDYLSNKRILWCHFGCYTRNTFMT